MQKTSPCSCAAATSAGRSGHDNLPDRSHLPCRSAHPPSPKPSSLEIHAQISAASLLVACRSTNHACPCQGGSSHDASVIMVPTSPPFPSSSKLLPWCGATPDKKHGTGVTKQMANASLGNIAKGTQRSSRLQYEEVHLSAPGANTPLLHSKLSLQVLGKIQFSLLRRSAGPKRYMERSVLLCRKLFPTFRIDQKEKGQRDPREMTASELLLKIRPRTCFYNHMNRTLFDKTCCKNHHCRNSTSSSPAIHADLDHHVLHTATVFG